MYVWRSGTCVFWRESGNLHIPKKESAKYPPRDWYIFNLKPGTIEISQVDKITSLSLFTDMMNAQACQEQDRGPELVVFISVCHLYQFYFSPLFQFDDPVI